MASAAALRAATGISYDERSQGTLQLFRTRKQLDEAAFDTAVLERCKVPYALLDVAGCEAAEPALARVRGKIVGGLRLPGDETGDCFKFTANLAKMAEALGVKFRYGVEIRQLVGDSDQITGVITSAGEMKADSFVLALGSYSPLLLRGIDIRIPVYPVKGHSITIPIVDPAGAPQSTVMDETYKVVVKPLSRRRATGPYRDDAQTG